MNNGLQLQKLVFAAKLKPNQKLFLLAIAERLGSNENAWPGYGDLQKLTGLSRRTLIRVRTELEAAEILFVSGEAHSSNVYTPNLQKLAELSQGRKTRRGTAVITPSTGVKETPQWCHGDTEVVSERHHCSVTVAPERPRERPTTRSKNAPADGVISDRGGEGHSCPAEESRLSDFIKNHQVSEIVSTVEAMILPLRLANSTRPVDSVAASTVRLLEEIKTEEHRYPSAGEVADAIGDSAFHGLRSLSFGLLTGKSKRQEFKSQILRRMRGNKLYSTLAAPNSADRHDSRVGEAKRELRGHWCDIPEPEEQPSSPEVDSILACLE